MRVNDAKKNDFGEINDKLQTDIKIVIKMP